MDPSPYTPIACDVHDQLLAYATLGQICVITYLNAVGEAVTVEDRIADVFTQAGAEYMKLRQGTVIRLDYLHKIHPLN